MTDSWYKYSYKTDDNAAEEIASLLILSGAEGAVVVSENIVEAYYRGVLPPNINNLKVTLLEHVKVKNENWVQKNFEILTELKVGALTVKPIQSASELPPSPNANHLYIIPGLGFGTGHHETTRSLIEWMQKLKPMPNSVLDVGTGSGILAITAKLLWNCKVSGFDNDPDAINNAKENCIINNLNDLSIFCGAINDVTGCYDLVLANLYAELLVEFAPKLHKKLNNNGVLLLSGILANKVSMVFDAFADYNLQQIDTVTNGNWSSIWYKRL